jgi:hypothetical protein
METHAIVLVTPILQLFLPRFYKNTPLLAVCRWRDVARALFWWAPHNGAAAGSYQQCSWKLSAVLLEVISSAPVTVVSLVTPVTGELEHWKH